MTRRPETWAECWTYAQEVGYPRTVRGWLRAWGDLARAAHPLTFGVRRTPLAELQAEQESV